MNEEDHLKKLTKKKLIREVLLQRYMVRKLFRLTKEVLDEWSFWNKISFMLCIVAFGLGILIGVKI